MGLHFRLAHEIDSTKDNSRTWFSGKKTKAGFHAVKQPSTGNHRGPCQRLLARLNRSIRTHKHRVPHRSEVSFIQYVATIEAARKKVSREHPASIYTEQ
jgi:hypothetical protein